MSQIADNLKIIEERIGNAASKAGRNAQDIKLIAVSKTVDAARSMGLCEAALDMAQQQLVTGGAFICKIFQGGDTRDFINAVRVSFTKVKTFKPKSSRKASKEIFIIGFGKKQEETICQVTANGLQ